MPYKNAVYAFYNTKIGEITHLTQPEMYHSLSTLPHILLTTELI